MENKDLMDSILEDFELLERHISVLRTVKANEPIGLIRLSEITEIPKHKVRYSLKLLERDGIIIATPDGAVVSDEYGRYLELMTEYIGHLEDRIHVLRDMLDGGS